MSIVGAAGLDFPVSAWRVASLLRQWIINTKPMLNTKPRGIQVIGVAACPSSMTNYSHKSRVLSGAIAEGECAEWIYFTTSNGDVKEFLDGWGWAKSFGVRFGFKICSWNLNISAIFIRRKFCKLKLKKRREEKDLIKKNILTSRNMEQ